MIDRLKFKADDDINLVKTFQAFNPDAEFLFNELIEGFHIKLEDFKEYLDKLNYTHLADIIELSSITSYIVIRDEYGEINTMLKYTTKNTDKAIMPNKYSTIGAHQDPDLIKIISQHYDLYMFDDTFDQKYPAVTAIRVISVSKDLSEIKALRTLVRTKGIFNAVAKRDEKNDKVYIISPGQRGLELKRYSIPTETYKDDIIKDNYNDNFEKAYDKLIDFLESEDEPGFVLFTGEPGTGKTSIINHLAGKAKDLNKKFVLLPSAYVGVLSDPTFLQFAVEKMKGAVLCIEDAEDILKSRDTRPDSAVSNILNITDGILGKISNLKVICTLNNDATIDQALLRKGRLKLKYKFDKLNVNKANALAKKLGKEETFNKSVVLSDVYNADDVNEFVETKKKTIGFNN